MELGRSQTLQLAGGLLALAIAFAGIGIGLYNYGHQGVLTLFLSVPSGVLFGWMFVKLLEFSGRILDE